MIVVDANVWLAALVDASDRGDWCRAVLAADPDWEVPGHCPLEVLRALRKYELAGLVAATAAERLAQVVFEAHWRVVGPDPGLLGAVWTMRHNVSVDDAFYLVLAARDGVSLATCDQRLARAADRFGVTTLADA